MDTKLWVGMTNGSGNGRLRGIGTDRKRVRKERKRVERKVRGEKGIFFVVCGFTLYTKVVHNVALVVRVV